MKLSLSPSSQLIYPEKVAIPMMWCFKSQNRDNLTDHYWSILLRPWKGILYPPGRVRINTMTSASQHFTEINAIDASSLPRPGTPEFHAHIDEIVSAAKKVIDSTPEWKPRGRYHHMVDMSERTDWRGKRNWFLRRSVHKDVPFEAFKVHVSLTAVNGSEVYWRIMHPMRRSSLPLSRRPNSLKRLNLVF